MPGLQYRLMLVCFYVQTWIRINRKPKELHWVSITVALTPTFEAVSPYFSSKPSSSICLTCNPTICLICHLLVCLTLCGFYFLCSLLKFFFFSYTIISTIDETDFFVQKLTQFICGLWVRLDCWFHILSIFWCLLKSLLTLICSGVG